MSSKNEAEITTTQVTWPHSSSDVQSNRMSCKNALYISHSRFVFAKKKSDHQAKSISAYCVYLYRHRSVEWCHYKVNYSLQIWQLNCQPCQFFNPLGFTFCILHSVVKVEDKLSQNIHLVPKSFDKYRVRCRSGGAFLAEKPPPSSVKYIVLLTSL